MKFPIIIVGTPRTGTTVYSEHLSKLYNLECISEPTLFLHNSDLNDSDFLRLQELISQKNNRFVLKILYYQYHDSPIFKQLIENDNCYKIKVYRQDKIEQIASLYMAWNRGVWQQRAKSVSKYSVSINTFEISKSINDINGQIEQFEQSCLKFDEVISYEEISKLPLNYEGLKKITCPTNYDFLKEKIKRLKELDKNINPENT